MLKVNREKLKKLMIAQALTMKELSLKAGLGSNWVATFLCGQTELVRLSTVGKLCAALGCKPEDIAE